MVQVPNTILGVHPWIALSYIVHGLVGCVLQYLWGFHIHFSSRSHSLYEGIGNTRELVMQAPLQVYNIPGCESVQNRIHIPDQSHCA